MRHPAADLPKDASPRRPWFISRPTPQHLKRLVRRVRDRLWIEAAAEKGIILTGTPARCPQDIATYITLCAVHRLAGRPTPMALGRPDVGPCAWFASRETARIIGRRFDRPPEDEFFDRILHDVPAAIYRDPRYRQYSGEIRIAGPEPIPYAAFAALMPARDRTGSIDSQRFARYPEPSINCKEDLIVAGLVFNRDVVGLTVFRKPHTERLYRVGLFGLHPGIATTGHPHARRIQSLFRQYTRKIFGYPELSFDFIDTIAPAAAMLGHSMFRDTVDRECRRLRALAPSAAAREVERVTTYPYPTFEADQRIGKGDQIRTGLKLAGNRMISAGRRIMPTRWPERETEC